MIEELKEFLNEGGAKVFTKYAVEIGDALWSALYSYIEKNYPDGNNGYCSVYRIDGIYEEGGQKFAVLQNRTDMKYYRLNFSLNDNGFEASETLIEVTKSYTPSAEPQFALEDVEAFELDYAAKKNGKKEDKDDEEKEKKSDDNSDDEDASKKEPNTDKESDKKDDESEEDDEEKKKKKKTSFAEDNEDEKKCPECGKPVSECTCEEDKKAKYSLDEIPEYVELLAKYSTLETDYNELVQAKAALEAEMTPLVEFKKAAEKKDKEAMIASFYMLSDEDKKDVIENIDTYSLNDIEAKLSIICVRNKVSFDLEKEEEPAGPTTYNLNDAGDDGSTPAWVKAVMAVAETMN